jgi:glycerate 2-kinase
MSPSPNAPGLPSLPSLPDARAPPSPRPADTHPALAGHPLAEQAIEAFLAAVAAVDPTVLVRTAVRQGLLDDWFVSRERPRQIHVLALGKAAPRMLWGLVEASVPFKGFGVAPKGVPAPNVDTFHWLTGEHPVPGPQSLAAGFKLLEWIDALPDGANVLALLSGGASACVEVLPPRTDAATLTARWQEWLRAGLPIEEMNQLRSRLSILKGGLLGQRILHITPNLRVWLLADTDPATAPATVGSAPLFQAEEPAKAPHRILASNQVLVTAAGLRLGLNGVSVFRHAPRIGAHVDEEAQRFLAAFHALPGTGPLALVGGGEPTVVLPPGAPRGGRCHHAALSASQHLQAGELFLAAASDGVDGSSGATGAWTTAADWDDEADRALASLDAARLLRDRARTFDLGATGTNVNDLWVALRG